MPHPTTSQTLDQFRERLQRLRGDLDAAEPLDRDRLADEIHNFELILEEIQVAEEELLLQNEELISAHESFETERLRFLNLFEFAPDAFLVTDLAGVVRESNKAASDLLATPQQALRGKPLAVYMAEDKCSAFRNALHRLGAGERLEPWEVTLQPRGGRRPVPVVLNAALQPRVGEQPGGLLWTARDVSASHAAAAALRDSEEQLRHAQRMEAVGRLAGGIAHSFNNLLAAMAFHGELLAEGINGDQRMAGHLHEVQEAIERGASLASQLLAFSRKQVLQPRVMSVNDVIVSMEPMLQQLIGHQVRLKVQIDPEAGAVFADPAQLEQVLLNLMVNARDAMPEGGRLVLKTAHAYLAASGAQDLPPGHYACLVVEDSGTGMSEEVQARLFEPFFTTKGPDKGTGLGLSTVYGIVRQSGGNVRVESAPGRGSRFEVYLPRVTAPAEAPVPAVTRRRRPGGRRGGSEVVLLVEDEDNIREPACEILEGRGYTVLAASNGAEALALAARHAGPIHLLVSDVVMPGMNGRQLAAEISHLRPEAKVLLMSGYPEPPADGPASGAAADQQPLQTWTLLQKPFPPRLLLDRIREVLDHSPSPEEHHDAA